MTNKKELIDSVDDFGVMSEINVIPFIDVMLVLLIIFMVTAPLMMGGVHINLPKSSNGAALQRPDKPLVVSLDAENRIFLDKEEVTVEDKIEYFKKLALESESGEIYLKGDGEIKYAEIMNLMSQLGQAGFARVTLVTNLKGNEQKEKTMLSKNFNQISSENRTGTILK